MRQNRFFPTHALHTDIRGASALEFALVAPVLFAVLFAITGLGKIYFDRQSLQYAVEAAGREIALTGTITQADLTAAIKKKLNAIGTATVTTNYSIISIDGTPVGHLSATMTRDYFIPLITTYAMNYTADTYMPVAQ